MDFAADILLGVGAFTAAIYCFVLSKKLSKLKGLDQDLGSAIAVLSKQVDEMTSVLITAQETAKHSTLELTERTEAAGVVSDRLELMITALQNVSQPLQEQSSAISNREFNEDDDVTVFMRNPDRKKAS